MNDYILIKRCYARSIHMYWEKLNDDDITFKSMDSDEKFNRIKYRNEECQCFNSISYLM